MRQMTQLLACTFSAATLLVVGCGTPATPKPDTSTKQTTAQKEGNGHADETAKTDDHSGWWCNEHGVPEGVCALCSSKVAAEFQKKGDWCKEHERPDSQCFKCHPELEAKFAATYEAKYGKKPPKPEMN